MTSIRANADRPAPLPIRVRPQRGESVESYVRRLALANHLRPSYLHSYLCPPPYYFGAIQPDRLAAVTGRTLDALTRAFPSLNPRPRNPRTVNPKAATDARRQARTRLFIAIRRANVDEPSIRSLATRFGVHRRTIAQALADPNPPARKPLPRRGSMLDELRVHVEAILDDDPDLPTYHVWQRLIDEHAAEISYSTLRGHIAQHRPIPPARSPIPSTPAETTIRKYKRRADQMRQRCSSRSHST